MRTIKIAGNATFYGAMALALYIIVNFFIAGRGLPPGVCPLDTTRPLLYVTIGLAIASFVLSVIESRLKKAKKE